MSAPDDPTIPTGCDHPAVGGPGAPACELCEDVRALRALCYAGFLAPETERILRVLDYVEQFASERTRLPVAIPVPPPDA